MAKIDTTKIEGYADMTAEQKLAALEAFELPDNNSAELERLKNAVSKANSEAAEYKKQLRAKQTDAEIKAAEDEKARTEMEKELEGLRREKTVSDYKAKFLDVGYSAEDAQANAVALADGKFDTIFASQKAFTEAQKKAAVAGSLDNQPGISSGNPLNGKDKDAAQDAQLRGFMGLPVVSDGK
ncbi:hypothetical protein [Agathobaculum sp.]|uniref:hypothetical protein n=1 Tax=Agathobaculum sp. TaxID=2048138 RepID=UPI003522DC94